MKDYKTYVSNGEELANQIISLGHDGDCVEGALVDNYFFETDRGVKVGRSKPRKYIMILAHFLNTWSSDHELIETDSDEEFQKTLKNYQEDYEKSIAEDC